MRPRAAEGARRDALHRVGGGILPRLHHHDGGGNRDDARSSLRQPGQHDRSLRGARVAHDRVRHVHARLLVHDGVPRRRERLQRAEREHERRRQDSHRDAARARHDRSSSHSLAPSSSSDESLANAGWPPRRRPISIPAPQEPPRRHKYGVPACGTQARRQEAGTDGTKADGWAASGDAWRVCATAGGVGAQRAQRVIIVSSLKHFHQDGRRTA